MWKKHRHTQIVPKVLEGILLPCHGIQNWRHIDGEFGTGLDDEEMDVRTSEHPAYVLKHPKKKRPLYRNDKIWATYLI